MFPGVLGSYKSTLADICDFMEHDRMMSISRSKMIRLMEYCESLGLTYICVYTDAIMF